MNPKLHFPNPIVILIAVAMLGMVVLTGCGGGDDESSDTTNTTQNTASPAEVAATTAPEADASDADTTNDVTDDITTEPPAPQVDLTTSGDGFIIESALSPDGQWVGLETNAGFFLYSATDGSLQWFYPAERRGAFGSVGFSPDSSAFAFTRLNGTSGLIDVATGDLLVELDGDPYNFIPPVFNSDGSRVALVAARNGRPYRITVFDTSDGSALFATDDARGNAAFINDDADILTQMDALTILDAATGEVKEQLTLDVAEETTLYALSPNGAHILIQENVDDVRSGYIYNFADNSKTAIEQSNGQELSNGIFSGDGSRLIVGFRFPNLFVYDVATGNQIIQIGADSTSRESVELAFNHDGTRLMTRTNSSATVFDVDSGAIITTISHPYFSNNLAFSPDGSTVVAFLSGSEDGNVAQIDAATGEISGYWSVAGAGLSQLQNLWFAADGNLFVDNQHGLDRWDVATNERINELGDECCYLAAISPDEQFVVFAGNDDFTVYDVATNTPLLAIEAGSANSVADVVVSPALDVFAVSYRNDFVAIYDVATGAEQHRITAEANRQLAFSADGSTLYVIATDTIHAFDVATGEALSTTDGRHFVLLADGRGLVVRADDIAVVDPADNFAVLTTIPLEARMTGRNVNYAMVASPDSSRAAYLNVSGQVAMFDIPPAE